LNIKTRFAYFPTRVRTHCTGIWHYKIIWLEHYDEETVYLTQIGCLYKVKYKKNTS